MAADSQIYVGITIGAAFAGLKAFSVAQTALTSEVFEALGSRATTRELGFDRFWRNARTQTLHDPIDYKLVAIGDHALNGDYPAPSFYS